MANDVKKLLKRKERASLFEYVKPPKKNINTEDLVDRRKDAFTELNQWRSMLENAYWYAVPNYNPFINNGRGGKDAPGQIHGADLYDNTLHIAHTTLKNKMLSSMVPQGQQWVKFFPGDNFQDLPEAQLKAAKEATQRFTDQWFKILDRSNFYLAFGETLDDTLISTGVLTINEGTRKNPWRFEAVPVSHVLLEGDAMGGFSAIFRDWMDLKVNQIKQLWPRANLPHNYELKSKCNIYECSYIDYEADDNQKYKYVIMTDGQEVLYEESSPSWPWVVYRMSKLTGETRGRGPTLNAVPTQATINEAFGDELMAAAFIGNPMYMAASDSAMNSDNFVAKPGAIIPVQMIMGQFPIQQFPGGGNPQFNALVVGDLRQQINQMLYSFPLGPINSPDRTATEAQIRTLENLESFAAMVPRLQTEFFDTMIARTLYLMKKVTPETFDGIDPEVLDRLITVDGQILDLRYETPLMTARGQIKTQAILNFYNAVAQLLGPEIATTAFKPAKTIGMIADQQGIELKAIKDDDELEEQFEKIGQYVAEQAGAVPNE